MHAVNIYLRIHFPIGKAQRTGIISNKNLCIFLISSN